MRNGEPDGRSSQDQDIEHRFLIQRIADGDDTALDDLYHSVERRVYAYILSRVGDPHLAMDALSETMLGVWRSADRYAGNANVLTWIFGIARNKAVDQLRKHQSPMEQPDEDIRVSEAPQVDELYAAKEDADHLRYCVEGLTIDQREAIHLAFFQGLGYREIAELMDCSFNTVKTRVFRAKELLRRCLEDLRS